MITFPVGYHEFHPNDVMNFQMNRWYSFNGIGYDTLVSAGKEIKDFADWIRVFTRLADEAKAKGDWIACATCLRAAQFFTLGDTPEKLTLYEACMAAYEKAYADEPIAYERIPFETGYLPVMRMTREKGAKGTLVIHGGYDSFIQEFIPFMLYAYGQGFDVYMFEGPGQGEVLNRCAIKMTPEWEHCATAVLDHYALDDVTLIGVSLGGYLAARAAAYENRISRVILYDIIYDFYQSIMQNKTFMERVLTELLLLFPKAHVWAKMENQMMQNFFAEWLIKQGYYVYGVKDLPQYMQTIKRYHTRSISRLVKQDVLLMAGEDDLYTVFFDRQKKALRHAKSVTGRIFTREESASHHCQVGNLRLAIDYMFNWVSEKQG